MNKTININLGGFFFHIDEAAYQKLKRYLESISRSLSNDSQGKNEIIADIEARISELLSEKITDARQVVNESDIEDIIGIMGQPEDYAEAEEGYSEASYSYETNKKSGKKLFRDGDDKFLGGVASGIAHYFNIDVIWIRLAMLALFFGAGVGIIVYLIFWILLPEAKTTAEKLQMEGEPVNIDNIEKKIREEFTNVSENVKDFANNASEKIKNGANEFSEKMSSNFPVKRKKNNGLQDFLDTIGKIFLMFFKIIGKFIGIILVFVAAAVILSLIIGGFSVGSFEILNINGEFINYPDFFFGASLPKWLLTLSLFILIGIPFVILFVLGLRILSSNVKQLTKTTSLSLLGIWLVALIIMIFTGIEFGTKHAKKGKFIHKTDLYVSPKDTLTVKIVNDDLLFYQENVRRRYGKERIEANGETVAYSNDVNLNIKKSTKDKAYAVIQKKSNGRSRIDANNSAEKIIYNYKLNDNELILDAFFLSDIGNIYKDEEVTITIYLPETTNIYLDESVKYFLNDVKNSSKMYKRDMAPHYFIMTNQKLKCTDCSNKIDEPKAKQRIKKSI
ncbi:PspC domain-containing protein [uncultured Polaribacter sp.]|uniref:PspC domain-containing protein n=1 Tax=uncultured Polaribacter sp. TaxID=174711 RepID=UPI00260321E5|nr:PspC domain-containing protein [uncultured Polaribacter sp.]